LEFQFFVLNAASPVAISYQLKKTRHASLILALGVVLGRRELCYELGASIGMMRFSGMKDDYISSSNP
jgi:hypothetical protein